MLCSKKKKKCKALNDFVSSIETDTFMEMISR